MADRASRRWTVDEDAWLIAAVERGAAAADEIDWDTIAGQIPTGRTAPQCRERWDRALGPSVRPGSWSAEEDAMIRMSVDDLGQVCALRLCACRWQNASLTDTAPEHSYLFFILNFHWYPTQTWGEIAALMPGRTKDAIKQRWQDTLASANGKLGLLTGTQLSAEVGENDDPAKSTTLAAPTTGACFSSEGVDGELRDVAGCDAERKGANEDRTDTPTPVETTVPCEADECKSAGGQWPAKVRLCTPSPHDCANDGGSADKGAKSSPPAAHATRISSPAASAGLRTAARAQAAALAASSGSGCVVVTLQPPPVPAPLQQQHPQLQQPRRALPAPSAGEPQPPQPASTPRSTKPHTPSKAKARKLEAEAHQQQVLAGSVGTLPAVQQQQQVAAPMLSPQAMHRAQQLLKIKDFANKQRLRAALSAAAEAAASVPVGSAGGGSEIILKPAPPRRAGADGGTGHAGDSGGRFPSAFDERAHGLEGVRALCGFGVDSSRGFDLSHQNYQLQQSQLSSSCATRQQQQQQQHSQLFRVSQQNHAIRGPPPGLLLAHVCDNSAGANDARATTSSHGLRDLLGSFESILALPQPNTSAAAFPSASTAPRNGDGGGGGAGGMFDIARFGMHTLASPGAPSVSKLGGGEEQRATTLHAPVAVHAPRAMPKNLSNHSLYGGGNDWGARAGLQSPGSLHDRFAAVGNGSAPGVCCAPQHEQQHLLRQLSNSGGPFPPQGAATPPEAGEAQQAMHQVSAPVRERIVQLAQELVLAATNNGPAPERESALNTLIGALRALPPAVDGSDRHHSHLAQQLLEACGGSGGCSSFFDGGMNSTPSPASLAATQRGIDGLFGAAATFGGAHWLKAAAAMQQQQQQWLLAALGSSHSGAPHSAALQAGVAGSAMLSAPSLERYFSAEAQPAHAIAIATGVPAGAKVGGKKRGRPPKAQVALRAAEAAAAAAAQGIPLSAGGVPSPAASKQAKRPRSDGTSGGGGRLVPVTSADDAVDSGARAKKPRGRAAQANFARAGAACAPGLPVGKAGELNAAAAAAAVHLAARGGAEPFLERPPTHQQQQHLETGPATARYVDDYDQYADLEMLGLGEIPVHEHGSGHDDGYDGSAYGQYDDHCNAGFGAWQHRHGATQQQSDLNMQTHPHPSTPSPSSGDDPAAAQLTVDCATAVANIGRAFGADWADALVGEPTESLHSDVLDDILDSIAGL